MCFLLPVTLHMVFVFTLDELKKIEDKEKFPKNKKQSLMRTLVIISCLSYNGYSVK